MNKFVRKLGRLGKYSYTIVLPKKIIDKYGWKDGQKLVVEDNGRGRLEVRDWKRR